MRNRIRCFVFFFMMQEVIACLYSDGNDLLVKETVFDVEEKEDNDLSRAFECRRRQSLVCAPE